MLLICVLLAHASVVVSQYEGCNTSIIGGGPGGIYAAWRLVEADPWKAKSICIFERSERFGGRILSLRKQGPWNDLTVEMGAYRFNDAPMTERWSDNFTEFVFTPLTAAVIKNALNIPCGKYEPGNPNSTMLKIIDEKGDDAGYSTFVERMLQVARNHGVRVFNKTSLESVTQLPSNALRLHFESGQQVDSSAVILNLPQLPLLKILQRSGHQLRLQRYPAVLQASRPVEAAKLYVYYEDAWWRNYLNLTSGNFLIGSSGMQDPPLAGRYHDGHVRCAGKACRGFIEASYAYQEDAHFFVTHQLSRDPPFSQLNKSVIGGAFLLGQVHDALYRFHAAGLQAAGMAENVRRMIPPFAYLAHWGVESDGFGAGVHDYWQGSVHQQQVPLLAMKPLGGMRLFVANEAFGGTRDSKGRINGIGSWAESSLVMAENVLISEFDLKPPSWIDPNLYRQYVRYSNASEEIVL